MQPWAAFEAGPVETGDLRPADLPHRNMPLLRIDRINYQACTTIPLDAWVGELFNISFEAERTHFKHFHASMLQVKIISDWCFCGWSLLGSEGEIFTRRGVPKTDVRGARV